jgi:hypothetical protein
MPKKPRHIVQNYTLQRMSAVMSGSDGAAFGASLEEIALSARSDTEIGERLIALFEEYDIARNAADVEHTRNDWFSGWFPGQPVASMFLAALRLAAERASARGPALEVAWYWVNSPVDEPRVSIAVATSPAQITVVLFTPAPAYIREVKVEDATDPISIVEFMGASVLVSDVHKMSLISNAGPSARKVARGGRASKRAK